MYNIKFYIETSITGPGRRDGKYAGLVEYIKRDGTPETREVLGELKDTTFYASTIVAVIECFKKLNKNCNVEIYTCCPYFANTIERKIIKSWAENDWKKADGRPVRNAELWKEFSKYFRQHKIKVLIAKEHEYKNYLKTRMEE